MCTFAIYRSVFFDSLLGNKCLNIKHASEIKQTTAQTQHEINIESKKAHEWNDKSFCDLPCRVKTIKQFLDLCIAKCFEHFAFFVYSKEFIILMREKNVGILFAVRSHSVLCSRHKCRIYYSRRFISFSGLSTTSEQNSAHEMGKATPITSLQKNAKQ